MAKVTLAPEPSNPGGKDLALVTILAVLLIAATGWLVYQEGSPEHERYQQQFREAVRQRSGQDAARAVPVGIQQIWMPQTGGANRCVSCHLGTAWRGFERAAQPLRTHPPDILRAHPVERFGCTACHGGQGWALDRVRAHGHVPQWPDPLFDTALAGVLVRGMERQELMQLRCNVCHRYERDTAGAAEITRAKTLVDQKGCRACHRINGRGGLIGPDLEGTGDKNPAQYDYSHLPGRPSAFRWHAAHFGDPRALVPDTVMPNFHVPANDIRSLTLLVMSWQRLPPDARLMGGLPRADPEPDEQRRMVAEMERGPGGWFVRTGCYSCHPVAVFGVRSPTPIGPDLSTAADDTERRFSQPIDEFVRRPTGTMRAVFARQFMLSAAEKAEAVLQLRAAFARYEAMRAAGLNPLEAPK